VGTQFKWHVAGEHVQALLCSIHPHTLDFALERNPITLAILFGSCFHNFSPFEEHRLRAGIL